MGASQTMELALDAGNNNTVMIVVKELVFIRSIADPLLTTLISQALARAEGFEDVKSFVDECEAELEEMKRSVIPETIIILHDLLVQDSNSLWRIAGNQEVMMHIRRDECYTRFPLYGVRLVQRLFQGVERRNLLLPMSRFFHCLYKGAQELLPQINTSSSLKILDYLKNDELLNLAAAFNSSD